MNNFKIIICAEENIKVSYDKMLLGEMTSLYLLAKKKSLKKSPISRYSIGIKKQILLKSAEREMQSSPLPTVGANKIPLWSTKKINRPGA